MTIRALVVDDDEAVAALHARYLEMTGGFEVVGVAHDGDEAERLVASQRPDLLLLDIYLPDRSGLDLLRSLRATCAPVDVIAVTAARDIATIRSAIQDGALHYLIKPFTFIAFREKVQSYAAARARLGGMVIATQADVDGVLGALRSVPDAPKGISPATRGLVVERLRAAETAQSAAEVAQLTGLSRVTARRYLDHLVRTGQAHLEIEYGSPGRPEHRYRLSDAAI